MVPRDIFIDQQRELASNQDCIKSTRWLHIYLGPRKWLDTQPWGQLAFHNGLMDRQEAFCKQCLVQTCDRRTTWHVTLYRSRGVLLRRRPTRLLPTAWRFHFGRDDLDNSTTHHSPSNSHHHRFTITCQHTSCANLTATNLSHLVSCFPPFSEPFDGFFLLLG